MTDIKYVAEGSGSFVIHLEPRLSFIFTKNFLLQSLFSNIMVLWCIIHLCFVPVLENLEQEHKHNFFAPQLPKILLYSLQPPDCPIWTNIILNGLKTLFSVLRKLRFVLQFCQIQAKPELR